MESKPTVKVLILEDDEDRIKQFKRVLVPHNDFFFQLTVTDNVQHALDYVRHNAFDLVFIDNDLCPQHYDQPMFSGGEAGTGWDFAKQVKEMPNAQKTALYVVHSLNPLASGRIFRAIQGAGLPCEIRTFAWRKEEMSEVLTNFAAKFQKKDS
jgi:CheY-like chemotaxis protein